MKNRSRRTGCGQNSDHGRRARARNPFEAVPEEFCANPGCMDGLLPVDRPHRSVGASKDEKFVIGAVIKMPIIYLRDGQAPIQGRWTEGGG
jgi:hypothetical protein